MHFLIECLPLLAGPLVLLFFRLTRSPLIRWIGLVVIPVLIACLANQLSGEGLQMLWMDLLKAFLSTGIVLLLGRSLRRSSGK